MKILLDIRDDKSEFFMELLKNFPFVKAEPISKQKEKTISTIKTGVKEVNLIKKGKLKAISARDILDEI